MIRAAKFASLFRLREAQSVDRMAKILEDSGNYNLNIKVNVLKYKLFFFVTSSLVFIFLKYVYTIFPSGNLGQVSTEADDNENLDSEFEKSSVS